MIFSIEYEKFVINLSLKWLFLQLVSNIKYNSVNLMVKYFSFDYFRNDMFSLWNAVPMSTLYKTVDKS